MLRAASVALVLAASGLAVAAPLVPGEPMPALELQDQHDRPWRIAPSTRLVLFASGRKASDLVQAVLGEQPAGFLAARDAVYLADLGGMPRVVTRMFALPALRAQPFAVGVSLDAAALADWPRDAAAVTLIRLQDGRITAIERADDERALREALGLAR